MKLNDSSLQMTASRQMPATNNKLKQKTNDICTNFREHNELDRYLDFILNQMACFIRTDIIFKTAGYLFDRPLDLLNKKYHSQTTTCLNFRRHLEKTYKAYKALLLERARFRSLSTFPFRVRACSLFVQCSVVRIYQNLPTMRAVAVYERRRAAAARRRFVHLDIFKFSTDKRALAPLY